MKEPAQRESSSSWAAVRAAVPLVLLLAAPACLTSQLWRDDGTREYPLRVSPPELRVFRSSDAPGAFVLRLPSDAAANLRVLLPVRGAQSDWLLVRPRDHRSTVASVLAAASTQGTDVEPYLSILETPGGSAPSVTLCAWLADGNALRHLPGFALRASFERKLYVLQVPCDVTGSPEPPAKLGDEVRRFELVHERLLDDGSSTIARIAATPFVLAVDILISPFELWWYLAD